MPRFDPQKYFSLIQTSLNLGTSGDAAGGAPGGGSVLSLAVARQLAARQPPDELRVGLDAAAEAEEARGDLWELAEERSPIHATLTRYLRFGGAQSQVLECSQEWLLGGLSWGEVCV